MILFYFLEPEEVSCKKEKGFCVLADGTDQNAGVIKLDDSDGRTPQRKTQCLEKCSKHAGATGCELIWDNWFNKGCYVHTKAVAKGNGEKNHICWIFPKNESCTTTTKAPTTTTTTTKAPTTTTTTTKAQGMVILLNRNLLKSIGSGFVYFVHNQE